MGDRIDENVWEGEDEVDLTRTIKSDDEIASSDDESDSGVIHGEDKKSKKKRKFQEMKEKKKRRLLDENSESNDSLKQLNQSDMLELLQLHCPTDGHNIKDSHFEESDFFYPDLDESSATKSTKKDLCPFVRALSASLPSYKKILLNNNQTDKDKNGCPVLVIVCASALRATEIIKSVSSKIIKCKIAKLFAKHFKVQEQVEMLSSEYFPVAIGTPNRISKLIELGALSLRCAKVVLIDITEDSKHYNILSLHEVKHDFYRLLHNDIQPIKKHCKIALIKHDLAASSSSSKAAAAAASTGPQQPATKTVKKPFIDKKKKARTAAENKAATSSSSSATA